MWYYWCRTRMGRTPMDEYHIDGKLEQIPLYLSKDAVLKLHKQSPSYKPKNKVSDDTNDNQVDNSAVSELNETTEEVTV